MLLDDCRGLVWYNDAGGFSWRVYWDGESVREGSGCLDKNEAQREVEAMLAQIDLGNMVHPRTMSAARQALEKRLLDAGARAAKSDS
jgi:hypothetical protein